MPRKPASDDEGGAKSRLARRGGVGQQQDAHARGSGAPPGGGSRAFLRVDLLDGSHWLVEPSSDVFVRGIQFFEDYPYRWLLTVAAFLFAALLRYCVSLHPHSGMGVPPMFGDFEAQRHWLEVTTALPIGEWYHNTTNNDLQYWGLDYPPLTAYVSWACGVVANAVYPPMVELHTSRGNESELCRLVMRMSVLVLEVLLYFPAVWIFVGRVAPQHTDTGVRGQDISARSQHLWAHRVYLTLLILLQPALVLIDHGHFQYNNVALAFTLWAIVALDAGHDVLASIAFCLALNFKQMTLYYSPAFFFFILRRCIWGPSGKFVGIAGIATRLVPVAFGVIAVFVVHFAPFCVFTPDGVSCAEGIAQVLHRLFPFSRGLFESKVSNLWHAIDVVTKIRHWADPKVLIRLSTFGTAALFSPSCVALFVRRNVGTKQLLLALFCSSLSFYLAGFQVHEKSILLALLPAALLAAADMKLLALWFGTIATFSMYPLFVLDDLVVPYIIGIVGFALLTLAPQTVFLTGTLLERSFVLISFAGAAGLHVALLVAPPHLRSRFPDLDAVLVSLYSCALFVSAWVYGTYLLWRGEGDVANAVQHATRASRSKED